MKQLFFKYTSRNLSKQKVVRITFTDNEVKIEGSEMLIAGFIDPGMQYGIYNLKFNEQSFFSNEDYRELLNIYKTSLTEINENEFIRLYYDATARLLNKKNDLHSKKNQSVFKLDKNFHLYVHGDKSKMIRSYDEKGKYLKLYYQNQL